MAKVVTLDVLLGDRIDSHQAVTAAAHAYGFGMLYDVAAVAAVDAAVDGLGIVEVVGGYAVEDIETGLVEGHRVGGSQDAVVLQPGGGGVAHAVAIDREIVHHIDIDDLGAEIVGYRLGGGGHALAEVVATGHAHGPHIGARGLACRVYVGLAFGRGDTDGLIFEHASEAGHHMAFEMGQVDHEGVALQVGAYDIVLDMAAVAHGEYHVAFLVHEIDGGYVQEPVFADGLPMVFECVAATGIGCVALYDGAMQTLHQGADERGLKVVVAARLAGADLHCHMVEAVGDAAYGLEDADEALGCDVAGDIHHGELADIRGLDGGRRGLRTILDGKHCYCYHHKCSE